METPVLTTADPAGLRDRAPVLALIGDARGVAPTGTTT